MASNKYSVNPQERVPFEELDKLLKLSGLAEGKFSIAIGYGASTVSGWKNKGDCPRAAVLAAEGFISKLTEPEKLNGPIPVAPKPVALAAPPDDITFFVAVPAHKVEKFQALIAMFGAKAVSLD
jgi:hypothetical protein